MRIRIRIGSDLLIFGPLDPDLFFFSLDPDSDPNSTCNNWFMKLFLSWTKYKPESTNSSLKWWFIKSNFIPSNCRIKVGSGYEEKKFGSSSLQTLWTIIMLLSYGLAFWLFPLPVFDFDWSILFPACIAAAFQPQKDAIIDILPRFWCNFQRHNIAFSIIHTTAYGKYSKV